MIFTHFCAQRSSMTTAAFVPKKRGPRQNDVHEIRLFLARPQLHATLTQYTAWIAPQSLAVMCDTINAQGSEWRGDDAWPAYCCRLSLRATRILPDYIEHDGLRVVPCNCKRPGHAQDLSRVAMDECCHRVHAIMLGAASRSSCRARRGCCMTQTNTRPVAMSVNAARAAAASRHRLGHRGEGVGLEMRARRAGLRTCDFPVGTNDGFWTNRHGAPPHSLSPYPHRLYHPLQTSGICNGYPLHIPFISILQHLLGASLSARSTTQAGPA